MEKLNKEEEAGILNGLVTQGDIKFMKHKTLRDAYLSVFSGGQGELVLQHMLQELGFFSAVHGEGPTELRNYAMVLVSRVSGLDGRVQKAIVRSITSFSPRPLEAINSESANERKKPMAGPDDKNE